MRPFESGKTFFNLVKTPLKKPFNFSLGKYPALLRLQHRLMFHLPLVIAIVSFIYLSGCSSLSTTASELKILKTKILSTTQHSENFRSSPFANQKDVTHPNTNNSTATKDKCDNDLWQRIRNGYKLMPKSLPNSVHSHREVYMQRKNYLQTVFTRAKPFLFFIVQELENYNMPLELALLPIVESAFDPFAYSGSHAAGLWQFIPSTGAYFGLKKNSWYDGRRDVMASTAAAIEYLTYLHKLFDNDWLLALAAYNSGEGSLAKKISQSLAKGQNGDFWTLELSQETSQYVPRLLALADLVKNPQRYAIDLPFIPNCAYFEIITINNPYDIALLQEKADLSQEAFLNLNPAFNRSMTPPDGSYNLLIPVQSSEQLKKFIEGVNQDIWISMREHVIVRGDTLSKIALSNKIHLDLLKSFNNLESNHIEVGKVILIPIKGRSHWHVNERNEHCKGYRVTQGDSLLKIAQRFNLSLTELKVPNQLSSDTIKTGQTLRIPCYAKTEDTRSKTTIVYRIKLGDSLTRIASEFKVSVTDITRWNNIRRDMILRLNQALKILADITRL